MRKKDQVEEMDKSVMGILQSQVQMGQQINNGYGISNSYYR
jgi:hypothetical protein